MDKYDDLLNLINNLNLALDETNIRYYRAILKDLISDAKKDLQEEEEILKAESKAEKRQREKEYREMQGF